MASDGIQDCISENISLLPSKAHRNERRKKITLFFINGVKLRLRVAECLAQGHVHVTGQSQEPKPCAGALDTCPNPQVVKDHHSHITEPLSCEVAHSRTVFNLRDVLMAF
jgi:hypothetical protein